MGGPAGPRARLDGARWRVVAFLGAALVGLGACSSSPRPAPQPTTITGPGPASAHPCPSVPYTATASSQLAFGIVATGVDCETATTVVLGAREDDSGAPYDVDGFHCVNASTSPPTGNFYYVFECTRPPDRVNFQAQPVAVPQARTTA